MVVDGLLEQVSEAGNRRFIEAWSSWRGEAMLPRRSEVDLATIKTLLHMVALVEVISAEDIRIRVAGTGLRRFLGYELTGRNLIEVTQAGLRSMRLNRIMRMVGHPCGGALRYSQSSVAGNELAVEAVCLPVEADEVGRAGLLIAHVAPRGSLPDALWQHKVGMFRPPDEFRFIDIGAGVPADEVPPALAGE